MGKQSRLREILTGWISSARAQKISGPPPQPVTTAENKARDDKIARYKKVLERCDEYNVLSGKKKVPAAPSQHLHDGDT